MFISCYCQFCPWMGVKGVVEAEAWYTVGLYEMVGPTHLPPTPHSIALATKATNEHFTFKVSSLFCPFCSNNIKPKTCGIAYSYGSIGSFHRSGWIWVFCCIFEQLWAGPYRMRGFFICVRYDYIRKRHCILRVFQLLVRILLKFKGRLQGVLPKFLKKFERKWKSRKSEIICNVNCITA